MSGFLYGTTNSPSRIELESHSPAQEFVDVVGGHGLVDQLPRVFQNQRALYLVMDDSDASR